MRIATLVLEYLRVLVWPLTVLVIAVVFRERFAALLARVTRVEALGASAEFEQALRQAGVEEGPVRAPLGNLEWVYVESFTDIRKIGDLFRERGILAIDLKDADNELGKRVIDFVAGLVFYAHGSIERLTPRQFLIAKAV